MEGYDALTQRYRARFYALMGVLGDSDEWVQDDVGACLGVLRDVFFEEFHSFATFRGWRVEKAVFIRDVERMARYREQDDDPNQALAYRVFFLWLQAADLDNAGLIAKFDQCLAPYIERAGRSGRTTDLSTRHTGEYSCPHIADDAAAYMRPCDDGEGGVRENPAIKFVGKDNIAALAMARNELLEYLVWDGVDVHRRIGQDFEALTVEVRLGDEAQRRQFGMQLRLVGDLFLGDFGSLKAFSEVGSSLRETYISALGHARKLMSNQGNRLSSQAFQAFRLMLCAVHMNETELLLRCAAHIDDFLAKAGGGNWHEGSRTVGASSPQC